MAVGRKLPNAEFYIDTRPIVTTAKAKAGMDFSEN